MLKPGRSLKPVEGKATQALRFLLEQVPAIAILDLDGALPKPVRGVDIVANIEVSGRRHALLCDVSSSGQPRHVRIDLLQLRDAIIGHPRDATPVLIAPYLSPQAQALCREQEVGFLDFEGNACLIFDGIFIERQVASKPVADRRELRSLFKPKSAQVLRVMLRNPRQAWRVTELGQAAGVSLGHVSNVRAGLLDREWAQVSEEGLFLSHPDTLLDAWRQSYAPPRRQATHLLYNPARQRL